MDGLLLVGDVERFCRFLCLRWPLLPPLLIPSSILPLSASSSSVLFLLAERVLRAGWPLLLPSVVWRRRLVIDADADADDLVVFLAALLLMIDAMFGEICIWKDRPIGFDGPCRLIACAEEWKWTERTSR